jgi:dihydrofolate reductase
MRLVLQEFMSLDGVTQGPGSPDEDTTDGFTRGGWFVPFVDAEFVEIVTGWTAEADAYLFGRRTYEAFARDWPAMPDLTDPVAASLNGRPKYVASNTLTSGGWDPTTVLSGDVASQVAELRRQPGKELQIHGSARLGAAMLQAGLVDEVRLVVAPVVVGAGRRMFDEIDEPVGLRPTGAVVTGGGLAVHTYAPGGDVEFGVYAPEVHTFPDRS